MSIERDSGMRGGRLRVTLHAAVTGYVLRQWQVDCSPDASLKGREIRLRLADPLQLNGVRSAVLAPGYKGMSSEGEVTDMSNAVGGKTGGKPCTGGYTMAT
ncbi:hypothetical protein [Acidovorax sp. SDU_ACID1]|uniref:hypothetical protein n=1 Tax=Acidovorax sp. SDU_ACID1 TaxID=3136632 RepID=UPI003872E424